jgi:Pyruvate/2-oxoacid:ferredoxin oxidoreductase gamma subunit
MGGGRRTGHCHGDALGEAQAANLVLLGAYLGRTGMFSQAEVDATMEQTLKRQERLELNRRAVAKGLESVQSHDAAEARMPLEVAPPP